MLLILQMIVDTVEFFLTVQLFSEFICGAIYFVRGVLFHFREGKGLMIARVAILTDTTSFTITGALLKLQLQSSIQFVSRYVTDEFFHNLIRISYSFLPRAFSSRLL